MKKVAFNYLLVSLLLCCHAITIAQVSNNHKAKKVPYFLANADLSKHFSSYNLFNPAVPVYKIADGKIIHRFFDTSPISPSGRYAALFRLPYEDKAPQAGDAGQVVVVDLQTGKERVVSTSKGWESQMGANVQWSKTDNELYYNDFDSKKWKAFACKFDISTGKTRRMEGAVFMVSPDGTKLASYNLISSRKAQGGYGVVFPDSLTPKNIGISKTDGLYITDTRTGKAKRIVTIADIYEKAVPSIKINNPGDYEYYCFQVKWNMQGTKLLTTLQWAPKGGGDRRRSVITMNPDGTNIKTAITPDQWAKSGHHVNWCPDGEHISMNLNVEGDKEIELIRCRYDGKDLEVLYKTGSGHPSVNKDGQHIITDAYYNEKVSFGDGSVPLRLINFKTKKDSNIVRIAVVNSLDINRVDLHPAWDKPGNFVVFNGNVGGTRNVYIADLRQILKKM